MTVCTDVYVRPQTCNTISIYPSQVHPGRRIRPSGPEVSRRVGYPNVKPILEDDDLAIALSLLDLF